MAPFYGWASTGWQGYTATGDSLLFSTQFHPGLPGTQRMKGWS